MGQALQTCSNYWDFGIEPGPPRLVLRVVHTPIGESLGSRLSGFSLGDELAILRLETVKDFDTLRWRYPQDEELRERARGSQGKPRAPKLKWPPTYRFSVPRRSWRATVVGGGEVKSSAPRQACVLQMAASPSERTPQNVERDIEDAKDAASYAHRFNVLQLQKSSDAGATVMEGEPVPGIKIAAPVGCEVIASGFPAMIAAGDCCTLSPYSATEVSKYVFDGSEDFLEIPQAFFHFAAHTSNGGEYVCDLQGMCEEEGDVILLDPVVLRSGRATISDLLNTVMPGTVIPSQGGGPTVGPSPERFDALHPRCAQMCKVFDPSRRSAHPQRHCGMTPVSCGLMP